MDLKKLYMSLPADLSGSTSKNRFRFEICWGIGKMLDIYDCDDFTVIFDHACDIEIHLPEQLEFYQIKTQKDTYSYTINKALKLKAGKSVLGKLYILKSNNINEKINIKLAIVANTTFSDGKKNYTDVSELELASLSPENVNKIKQKLRDELAINDVDISNIYFIHTNMNVEDPSNEITGKIIKTFERIKNVEAIKPNSLCRLIFDTINDKACYENPLNTYEDVVKYKGITKSELDDIFNKHLEISDECVKIITNFIDRKFSSNIKRKRNYKLVLSKVIKYRINSIDIRDKEKLVIDFLIAHEDSIPDGDYWDIATWLLNNLNIEFSSIYDNDERIIFLIYSIVLWENGKYE